jgi:hypothetical protein
VTAAVANEPRLDGYHARRVRQELTAARISLQMAWLHAKGDAASEKLLLEAGRPVRAALVAFAAARDRGGM